MAIKPSDVEYRVLTRRDFPSVSQFHRDVGSQEASASTLLWQYCSKTLPMDGVIVGAFINGRLVGTQALIPLRAVMDGREILSAKSEHTLLDPACRGLGVFSAMYEVAFEWAAKEGIACIWGFTSAIKPFAAAKFQIGQELFDEAIAVRPFSYLATRFLGFKPSAVTSNVQSPIRMPASAVGNFKLVRDDRYLSYRYFENPFRRILWYDEVNGVLYTGSHTSGNAYISEITDASKLRASLASFCHQRVGSQIVRRITSSPLFTGTTIFPSIYRRTRSNNFIVFRWLHGDGQIPEFTVDEGYGQGIA